MRLNSSFSKRCAISLVTKQISKDTCCKAKVHNQANAQTRKRSLAATNPNEPKCAQNPPDVSWADQQTVAPIEKRHSFPEVAELSDMKQSQPPTSTANGADDQWQPSVRELGLQVVFDKLGSN